MSVIVILIVIFVISRCKVDCDKKKGEKFQRAELGQNDIAMFGRSAVDYYLDPKYNPHYLANPGSKYGPLSNGVDLFYEERKLDPKNGYVLFSQYDNEWSGSKHPAVNIPADQASRYHLTNMGDVNVARQLVGQSATTPNGGMDVAQKLSLGQARVGRFGTDVNMYGGGMNEEQMGIRRLEDNVNLLELQSYY